MTTAKRRLDTLSAADLLGVPLEDEGVLSLSSAPIRVLHSGLPNGVQEFLVVVGGTLGRRGLMDLLFAIAPYKAHGRDDFSGVLDDWHLHDRAATSAPSQKLFLEHSQGLRRDWREFSRHRRLFVDVLEDRTERTRLVPILRWQKQTDGRRRWRFEPPEASQLKGVETVAVVRVPTDAGAISFSPLAGFLTVPYFVPRLRGKWPEWRSLVRDGKSNYMGPAQTPVLALKHRAAILGSEFVKACESRCAGD